MNKKSFEKYAEVKASIKAQMESNGMKYPANKNGLSDSFICEVFAPKLEIADIIKIDAKRDEFRERAKASAEGKDAKVSNWFPAFRSWVGGEYFPEFDAKKAPKKSDDKCGKSLKELIAKMSKANNISLTCEEKK